MVEDPQYSADYLDPDRRSVTNAVQVHFQDRTSTSKVEVEYPLGHRRRRNECFPALEKKFMAALNTRMPPTRAGRVFERIADPQTFDRTAVPDCGALLPGARALPPPAHARGSGLPRAAGRGRRGSGGARVWRGWGLGRGTRRERRGVIPRIDYPAR